MSHLLIMGFKGLGLIRFIESPENVEEASP